jgi:hypothetical protein
MNSRVQIRLQPQDDRAFHEVFELALGAVSASLTELDAPEAAGVAEDFLRGHGYPAATVDYSRSIDEYLQHISHWLVWRDGRENWKRGIRDERSTTIHQG